MLTIGYVQLLLLLVSHILEYKDLKGSAITFLNKITDYYLLNKDLGVNSVNSLNIKLYGALWS